MKALYLALCTLLVGCISHESRIAEKAMESHLGDFRHQKISGPFGKDDRKQLAVLPEIYRERANALLEQGAIFFLTFLPHDLTPGGGVAIGQGGTLLGVVFVLGDKVVADYPLTN